MQQCTVQGEVEKTSAVFQWRLKESSLDDRGDSACKSPDIHFGGRHWALFLKPNKLIPGQSEAYIVLLFLSDSGPPIEATYSLCIRSTKGETGVCRRGTKVFGPLSRGVSYRFKRSELLRRRDELLPQDVLTVALEIKLGDGSSGIASPDLESLSGDISQLLESEIFPDVKLRCGDRTISAHRSILAGRSQVFAAMFGNEMAEKRTGIVDITDMESEVLDLLLRYVYSGKVPDLSHDTASSLYEASDMYSIHALKKSCSDWIVTNLTAENCLGCLLVADAHSDEEFREGVADFAARNLGSMKRDDWFKFNKDYPCLAISVYQRCLASTIAKQV